MKNRMRRLVSLLLAVLLLLALPACGRNSETDVETDDGPDPYGGIRYVPMFQTLDVETDSLKSGCVLGDYVYLTGSSVTDEIYHDREAWLMRIPLDGGEMEMIPGCEPVSQDRNIIASSEGLGVGAGENDTLWLFESVRRWTYDFPEDFDPHDPASGARGDYYVSSDGVYVLHRLDKDGNELSRQEWPIKEFENQLGLEYIGEMFISPEGNITIWDTFEYQLITVDSSGVLLGSLRPQKQNDEWQSLVRLGDGRLAMSGNCQENGEYRTAVWALSQKGDAWEDSWLLPAWTSVYSGDENALFYYDAGNDLVAWKEPAEGDPESETGNPPILSWVNTGIYSGGSRLVSEFLPDGRLVVVQDGGMWNEGESAELAVLTPTDQPSEKTVLTLGTVYLMSNTEKMVRDFNRNNQEYQIEVREYMDRSSGDWTSGNSQQDAMTRLAADVAAGRIPDILDTYGMPLEGWASSGILEDLWPWIDLDRDIDREDLMLRVLEADSIDGKLYEVSDGFTFTTVVGAKDAVGERTAWSAEDMWAALDHMPDGCLAMPYSKTGMLREMLMTFWNKLVDWEAGKCHFDSEEFRQVLEFCGEFPDEGVPNGDQDEMIRNGEIMLRRYYPGSFWDLQLFRSDFGSAISFVGFPNPWGVAGSAFNISSGFAMTSSGKHKEGAWAFLRTMLMPHDRTRFVHGFPMDKASFEELAWAEQDPNHRVGYTDSRGRFKLYEKTSQNQYDQVMALYESADSMYRWNESLGDIILEIAGAYFAGDKPLDETVGLIQNRASLYLSEQK